MRAYHKAYQSGMAQKQKEREERMRKEANQDIQRQATLLSSSSTEIVEAPSMEDVFHLNQPAGASHVHLSLPDVQPPLIAALDEVGQGSFDGDIHAPLLGLPQGGSTGSHSTSTWAAWFNAGR